jgi:hypothetical protein
MERASPRKINSGQIAAIGFAPVRNVKQEQAA